MCAAAECVRSGACVGRWLKHTTLTLTTARSLGKLFTNSTLLPRNTNSSNNSSSSNNGHAREHQRARWFCEKVPVGVGTDRGKSKGEDIFAKFTRKSNKLCLEKLIGSRATNFKKETLKIL